ncbi:MAG TPA: hypothetical protein DEG76_14810 [Pseudohongiella sp.]|nr:hypothetical protein [Pseudohongiella sp.]HBX38472.1 hypothetical protein [Pseudohongiella sp.]|tara:strand:- start:519047 stop:519418 length:372 start_codon:yes stop_codon:yes gene_type:complete
MKKMVIAIIAAYAVWTVIWLVGNATLFADVAAQSADGTPVTAVSVLLGILLLSIICSLAAGVAAALLDRANAFRAVLITGVLLVLTGVGVQASVWALMPAWYHLSFLTLIVPVTLLGARLVSG